MKELLINVTVIIFLTTVMDLLLPKSNMKAFIRMALGLFIIVTILSPILDLQQKDAWLDSWILTDNLTYDSESVMAAGEHLKAQNETRVLEEYKLKLERQINGLVYLADDVTDCRTDVELSMEERLGEMGKIKKVRIYLRDASASGEVAAKVKKMICAYYDLNEHLVEVQTE